MLVRWFAALVLILSTHAWAKSFSEYCLIPDNDAQINTIFRMLRAAGLPSERTPALCAAGEKALNRIDGLEFKYIVIQPPHSFLTVEVEPITDLQPLESVAHIRKLKLEGPTLAKAFANKNPLAALKLLKELTLTNVPMRELAFIEMLPSLEVLAITNGELKNISILENAYHLRALNLSANPITDFSILAKLPNLTEFSFAAWRTTEQLSSLEFVRPLTKLQVLRLDGHKIKYLTALENLKELRVLDLNSNRVMDVEPIMGMTKLKELNLSSNNINDISLLGSLTTLEKLSLAVNHITDPKALENLVNLRSLEISGNAIGYLSLHKLKQLESIRAISCNLTNLWGIPEEAQIKNLELSNNKITSLDRLAFMPNIEWADFYQNEVNEIWQLRPNQLLKLRNLSLTRNKVDSVEPLKGYINLLMLSVGENPVTDLSPLAPLQLPHANTEGKIVQLSLQH